LGFVFVFVFVFDLVLGFATPRWER
jgi:hypothetical protein